MTEQEILEHAIGGLFPRFTPAQIVEALASELRPHRRVIGDLYGLDDAPGDLRRLARKWRKLDPRKEGAR